jgi:kynurenine formamidase
MQDTIDALNRALGSVELIDLSHTLETGMPAWPTHARYGSVVYESYDNGDPAFCSLVMMDEHAGTHIDAPMHFVKGGATVDKLPLDSVMGRCVTVDARATAPCGVFPLEELRRFEEEHGAVRKGDIVLFRFGWDEKYALQPNAADFLKEWPGLSGEAAARLKDAGVKAVGTDAMALDAFGADTVCHHLLLGAGIPILENVHNLALLPVHSYIMGFPNKFGGGSASPIRLVALAGK